MDSSKPILGKITKKSDYLKMKTGLRFITPGFIIQGRNRKKESNFDPFQIRYGLTCSKRVGNAVKRNRAKRRMRALISSLLKEDNILFKEKYSYVLIAKQSILKASFFEMHSQLKQCLSSL